MMSAVATPASASTHCATVYAQASRQVRPPCEASANDTAGLKCARDRPEGQNQRDERGARREGVGGQRNGDIAAGQTLAHDPGAHDGGQEESRTESLGDELA